MPKTLNVAIIELRKIAEDRQHHNARKGWRIRRTGRQAYLDLLRVGADGRVRRIGTVPLVAAEGSILPSAPAPEALWRAHPTADRRCGCTITAGLKVDHVPAWRVGELPRNAIVLRPKADGRYQVADPPRAGRRVSGPIIPAAEARELLRRRQARVAQ